MMKRLNAVVMRRLAAAAVAAGLILGGGLAGAAPASAGTQDQQKAWFYSQTNYGGQAGYAQYWDQYFTWFSYDVHSVINHTPRDFCGSSGVYGSSYRTYTFWSGGAWSYIGTPFSSSYPLRGGEFCDY